MSSLKSSFSISDVKASVKSKGVLRPTRCEVILFPPQEIIKGMNIKEISIRCHTAHLPPFNIKTVDYSIGQGQVRKMPKGYEQGHIMEFTFYNDIGANVYNGLLQWSKYVLASKEINNYTLNYFYSYTGSVEIRQLDERDNIRYGYSLRDAYPISIDAVDLDSSHVNEAQLVKATIAFRYARTLEEVKLDNASSTASNKLNIATAVIDDINKYVSKGKYTTSSGVFKTRSQNYVSSGALDPTMTSVAKRAKGSGLPYNELYISCTNAIATTRTKGIGVYDDQHQYMNYASTSMDSALSVGILGTINSTWSSVLLQKNALTSSVDSFFSDVVSTVSKFNEIKPQLPENDQLETDMNDMLNTYRDVVNTQVDVNVMIDDYQSSVDE